MHAHKKKEWFCKTMHALTVWHTQMFSVILYFVLKNAGVVQTIRMTHKMVTASCLKHICLDIWEAIYNSEMPRVWGKKLSFSFTWDIFLLW